MPRNYAEVKSFAFGSEVRYSSADLLADISSGCGFLPKGGPLLMLNDSQFNEFVKLGESLAEFVKEKKVCETLNQMELPQFTPDKYSYRALVRVYAVATSLIHAYILESGGDGKQNLEPVTLPRRLSSWVETLSHQIGRLPSQTYETYVLQNYRLAIEASGYTLENIEPLVTYTGTPGEKWFIKMHVYVEHYAAKTMSAVEKISILLTTRSFDDEKVQAQLTEHLNEMHLNLSQLNKNFFHLMGKGLQSEQFYYELRPLLNNWEHGVIYEGSSVYKEVIRWRGASGAQSSFIPAIDLVCQLDIKQKETMHDMQNYMPPEHQVYLDRLRTIPAGLSNRIAATKNELLIEAYDNVTNGCSAFRRKHYTLFVEPYIVKNLVSVFTSNLMKSLTDEHSDLLVDFLGIDGARNMVSKLLESFFTKYKMLVLQYGMDDSPAIQSDSALYEVMARLKRDLFTSKAASPTDTKKSFEEAVLESFQKIIIQARIDYQRFQTDEAPSVQADERKLSEIINKTFDLFVELSSKSLGTGGEDFSLFLPKNIADSKNSALKSRSAFFKTQGDINDATAGCYGHADDKACADGTKMRK